MPKMTHIWPPEVHGFPVETPICHIAPISHKSPPPPPKIYLIWESRQKEKNSGVGFRNWTCSELDFLHHNANAQKADTPAPAEQSAIIRAGAHW